MLVRTVPYVNGVKTGYTLGAGNVLVGSAERDGIQLVSAVLGAPTESERDAATLELLNYGFSLYRQEQVLRGASIATASVRWQDERMPLVAERPVRVTVRRGQRVDVTVAAPGEEWRAGPARRAPGSRDGDRRRGARPARGAGRRPAGARGDRARAVRRGDRGAPGRVGRRRRRSGAAVRGGAGAVRPPPPERVSDRGLAQPGVPVRPAGDPPRLAPVEPLTYPSVILTVTLNAAIDRAVAVPNFRLGQRHRAVDARTFAGGKGVSIARALRLLGA